MNEIKLSTQVSEGKNARLAIKIDVESLGVDWKESDIIRVRSYKKNGSLILSKVGTKAKKTVAYGLTKTGGGAFSHDLGIYVNHKKTRFAKEFQPSKTVAAGARFVGGNNKQVEVFLPREIFA